jgi:hypothetical protein
MRLLYGIVVVGLVLLIAVPCARAIDEKVFENGTTLLRHCKDAIRIGGEGGSASPDEAYDVGYCMGYIVGVLDLHDAMVAAKLLTPQFCPPRSMMTGQAVRIVVTYLQANPEHLHFPGAGLVAVAMRKAFPCAPDASRPKK